MPEISRWRFLFRPLCLFYLLLFQIFLYILAVLSQCLKLGNIARKL